MSDTKIKISFSDGTTVELEGSEQFVERHWEELKPNLHDIQKPSKTAKTQTKERKPSKEKKKLSYNPIPINFRENNDELSLKEFYKEKLPESNPELVTVFAYYLKKNNKIVEMEMGHIISCYHEIDKKIPKSIYDICKNTKRTQGYLDTGDEPYTFKITISGENLVRHDLPKNKE